MYKKIIIVKTLNRGEIMKKIIMYSVYGVCIALMIGVIVSYDLINKPVQKQSEDVDYNYVYDLFQNSLQQVASKKEVTLIRPYANENVKIVKNYYDYKADEAEQRESIIYYDGTYMQNTGISYGLEESFDVVAVLDGEVTEVTTDELIGNSITIKHSDNTFSVYQSIKDITVKVGDRVIQGDKLATTGTSNISKELNNHLYFELIIEGISVNPEEYYDSAL